MYKADNAIIMAAGVSSRFAPLSYEGEYFDVPAQYEKKLAITYGDYMQLPPMEKRVSHHHVDVIDISKSYTEYM